MLCNQEGRQFGNARLFAQSVFLAFRILASFLAPGARSWAAWPGPSSSRIWVLAGGSAHKRKHREGFVVGGPNQGISVWGGQRDRPVDGSTVGGFIGAQRRACSPDWGVRNGFPGDCEAWAEAFRLRISEARKQEEGLACSCRRCPGIAWAQGQREKTKQTSLEGFPNLLWPLRAPFPVPETRRRLLITGAEFWVWGCLEVQDGENRSKMRDPSAHHFRGWLPSFLPQSSAADGPDYTALCPGFRRIPGRFLHSW